MNIKYEDRIEGEIYYCLCSYGYREYIFQWYDSMDSNDDCYHISREVGCEWEGVGTGADFGSDWIESNDKVMRLATQEERSLFLQKAEEYGISIEYEQSYEIY